MTDLESESLLKVLEEYVFRKPVVKVRIYYKILALSWVGLIFSDTGKTQAFVSGMGGRLKEVQLNVW